MELGRSFRDREVLEREMKVLEGEHMELQAASGSGSAGGWNELHAQQIRRGSGASGIVVTGAGRRGSINEAAAGAGVGVVGGGMRSRKASTESGEVMNVGNFISSRRGSMATELNSPTSTTVHGDPATPRSAQELEMILGSREQELAKANASLARTKIVAEKALAEKEAKEKTVYQLFDYVKELEGEIAALKLQRRVDDAEALLQQHAARSSSSMLFSGGRGYEQGGYIGGKRLSMDEGLSRGGSLGNPGNSRHFAGNNGYFQRRQSDITMGSTIIGGVGGSGGAQGQQTPPRTLFRSRSQSAVDFGDHHVAEDIPTLFMSGFDAGVNGGNATVSPSEISDSTTTSTMAPIGGSSSHGSQRFSRSTSGTPLSSAFAHLRTTPLDTIFSPISPADPSAPMIPPSK
jgi:hypothetical protein